MCRNVDSKRQGCENREEKWKQMIKKRREVTEPDSQEFYKIDKVTVRHNIMTKHKGANLQSMDTQELEKTALLIKISSCLLSLELRFKFLFSFHTVSFLVNFECFPFYL